MNRKTFLTFVALIACGVGAVALFAPGELLASKGVTPTASTSVWVREVGVALIAFGVMAFRVRTQPDSPTMRAFLLGNLILQVGLFPIEILAFSNNVITKLSGILPNSILHLLLATGFGYFAFSIKPALAAAPGPAHSHTSSHEST